MIILCNVSSDWSRESHDRTNKTSCLPGNKYRVSPLQKSRDFSFQRYEKSHSMLTNMIKSKISNHLNFLYTKKIILLYLI